MCFFRVSMPTFWSNLLIVANFMLKRKVNLTRLTDSPHHPTQNEVERIFNINSSIFPFHTFILLSIAIWCLKLMQATYFPSELGGEKVIKGIVQKFLSSDLLFARNPSRASSGFAFLSWIKLLDFERVTFLRWESSRSERSTKNVFK